MMHSKSYGQTWHTLCVNPIDKLPTIKFVKSCSFAEKIISKFRVNYYVYNNSNIANRVMLSNNQNDYKLTSLFIDT